jgi:trehalose 6-phosphate synthase
MKSALLEAYAADEKELTKRMKAMRKTVSHNDVAAWAESFMAALADVRDDHGKTTKPARRD